MYLFHHFGERVPRERAQEFGLQVAYSTDNMAYKYICKLLSLPHLPVEHLSTIFTVLQQKAATEPLKQLTSYIYDTWLNSPIWPITAWSLFGHLHQNNDHDDVEGWQFRMNNKAKKDNSPSVCCFSFSLKNPERWPFKLLQLVSDN